jgi:hypothetical protein
MMIKALEGLVNDISQIVLQVLNLAVLMQAPGVAESENRSYRSCRGEFGLYSTPGGSARQTHLAAAPPPVTVVEQAAEVVSANSRLGVDIVLVVSTCRNDRQNYR